jgi:hypothetical protein
MAAEAAVAAAMNCGQPISNVHLITAVCCVWNVYKVMFVSVTIAINVKLVHRWEWLSWLAHH